MLETLACLKISQWHPLPQFRILHGVRPNKSRHGWGRKSVDPLCKTNVGAGRGRVCLFTVGGRNGEASLGKICRLWKIIWQQLSMLIPFVLVNGVIASAFQLVKLWHGCIGGLIVCVFPITFEPQTFQIKNCKIQSKKDCLVTWVTSLYAHCLDSWSPGAKWGKKHLVLTKSA